MADETGNTVTEVWMGQPPDRIGISLEDIRRKSEKLERKVFWRNAREYVAGALVAAAFGYYASVFQSAPIRAGCVLVIAGALLVVFRLHKAGAARAVPAEWALRPCADFQRRELERQRDLLLGVWRWYLLPFVPGLAVFLLGLLEFTLRQPRASEHVGTIVAVFALTSAGCAVVFAGVGKLNRWAAYRLQREIDALAPLEQES
jgi:hypothetical protein